MRSTRLFHIYIATCTLLFCISIFSFGQTEKQSPKDYILLLNFYRSGNEWSNVIQNEIIKHLRDNKEYFYVKNLFDATSDKEKTNPDWWKKNMSNLPQGNPRMIFFLGDAGWIVYRHYVPSVWKKIPCIILPARPVIVPFEQFSHNKDIETKDLIPFTQTMIGFRAIGLMHNHYCKETIDMIRTMQPGIKQLIFISDNRLSSAMVRVKMSQTMQKYFKDLKYITLDRKNFENSSTLLDTIRTFGRNTGIIYYSWYATKDKGETTDYTKKMIGLYANVPVFTLSDFNTIEETSISGGYYNSGKDIAKEICDVIDKYIHHQPIAWGSIIQISHPQKYLNYRSLIEKGINPDLIPQDAILFDKPDSFYERHKYSILASIITLIFLLFMLVKYALMQRNLRHEKEKEIMHLNRYKKLFNNMPIAYSRYYVHGDMRNPFNYQVITKNAACQILFEDEQGNNFFADIESFIFSDIHKNSILRVSEGDPTFYIEVDHQSYHRYYDTYICPSERKSIIDIFMIEKTKQIESMHKMQEYSKMNRRILGMLPDTIIIVLRDHSIEQILNPNEHCMTTPAKDAIGQKLTSFYASDSLHRLDDAIEKAFTTNELVTFNYEFTKGDEVFYFNVRINTLSDQKGCCYIHEYTEMMRDKLQISHAKTELEHLNHKLQMVLEAADVMPWTIDLNNKTVTIQDNTVSIHDIRNYIHPDDYDTYIGRLRKLANNTDPNANQIETQDIRVKYFSNEYRWYKIRCIVDRRDNRGKPIFLIGSTEDIDKQRQIEANLIQAKEKAEESNRLKSAFLANMSHEIRTPLNAIVGFSNILASTSDLGDSDKQEFIKNINTNNELLLQLINDVLDLAKIDAGTIEFVYMEDDFAGIIKDVMISTQIRISKAKNVEFIIDQTMPESCITYTDRRRVTQVINNFITNAIKFTSVGSITLGYHITENNMIHCYVKDTGIGISQEQQEQIFERFVKLNSFVQGTGLGLSICQMIIRKMHGTIGVTSEVGKGSTFWFELPILSEAPEEIQSNLII